MTIKDAVQNIQELTHEFQKSFGMLDDKKLNWKINSESWSIAQNLDHLIKINTSYYPTFEQIKEGKINIPFLCRSGFMQSRFGDMILKSVLPENTRKTKTFPIWQPAQSEFPSGILQTFIEHQSEFSDKLSRIESIVNEDTAISSPANKYIVYKFYKALDIIVEHEKRHLNQARSILSEIPKEG